MLFCAALPCRRMVVDKELELGEKLALAVAERTKGDSSAGLPVVQRPETLPKASHLETRAYALLRQLDKAAARAEGRVLPGTGGARRPAAPRAGSAAPGAGLHAPGHGPLSSTRVKAGLPPVPPRPGLPPGAAAASTGSAAAGMRGLTAEDGEALLGSPMMVIVRKLRTLQVRGARWARCTCCVPWTAWRGGH